MNIGVILEVVAYPFLALAVSLALTALCIRVLPKLGFVDMPDSRRVHHTPTPRGGGFAIIAGFFVACGAMLLLNHSHGTESYLREFWLPALIIALTGALDDRFSLGAKTKLAAQIIAAFLVWYQPFRDDPQRLAVFFVHLPTWASCIVTMFLVVTIINAFNLIDGLDGLAAGLSVVSAGCLAAWALLISRNAELMLVYLILAGSCLGFLRYNFSPARIFMGDTGSNFLGLFFAAGVISSMTSAATTVSVLIPLMAVGVPIFDVFLAFWRRSLRRIEAKNGSSTAANGIMAADMDHLHHRIFAGNHSQRRTAIFLYMLACCFALGGVAVMMISDGSSTIGYFLVVIVAVIAVRKFATVELIDSAKILVNGLRRPSKGLFSTMMHPSFDLCCFAAAHVCANLLTYRQPFDMTTRALPFASIIFITLVVAGIYRIYWLRASIRDYRYLAEMLLFGSLLSFAANRMFDGPWSSQHAVIFVGLTIFFIFGERLTLRYVEAFMLRQIFMNRTACTDLAVIFGAGQGCRTYLSAVGYTYDDLFQIIGIIDDDKMLHGMEVYGHTVLGGQEKLEAVYRRRPFQRLIVTTRHITDDKLAGLQEFCDRRQVRLFQFRAETQELPPVGHRQ